MDICDFSDFCSKFVSSAVRAHAIELDTIPDPSKKGLLNSDHHRLVIGSYESLHFPILFKQQAGKRWDDILDTGWISLYLISDRMKMVLGENNLTGWKTFPIKLFDKNGNEVFGYHGFSVTGRCGPINYTKGEIIRKQVYEGGPVETYYKGRYIGLDKWDGTDFFMTEGDLGIIITRKTADILKKNKFSNVFLRNLADVEIEESVAKL